MKNFIEDGNSPALNPIIYPYKMTKYLRIISDITKIELKELNVLDLACNTGSFSIEFAKKGAKKVLGIEGRHENFKKCRSHKKVLNLKNLYFKRDLMQNVNIEKYGTWDIILAAGILYHLTVPDSFEFLKNLYQMTDKLLILETQVAISKIENLTEAVDYKDNTYYGFYQKEYQGNNPEYASLSSIGNTQSFWFTPESLTWFLFNLGFSSVYLLCMPPQNWILKAGKIGGKQKDEPRGTFVAIKN